MVCLRRSERSKSFNVTSLCKTPTIAFSTEPETAVEGVERVSLLRSGVLASFKLGTVIRSMLLPRTVPKETRFLRSLRPVRGVGALWR
jgi:hypothetical protein